MEWVALFDPHTFGTIVRLICWVWAIEVGAALLMYTWVLRKRRPDASRTSASAGKSEHYGRAIGRPPSLTSNNEACRATKNPGRVRRADGFHLKGGSGSPDGAMDPFAPTAATQHAVSRRSSLRTVQADHWPPRSV